MKYTFKGKLQSAICDEHEFAIANTTIRFYGLNDERNAATAFTAAQSKEVSQVFEETEIKKRNSELLAETKTDASGNYEVTFDGNKTKYEGGSVVIVLYYNEIPDYGQKDTKKPKSFKPFEVLLDIIQPKWRQMDNELVAGWNYTILKRIWCYILKRLDIWVICGTLTNCKSQAPLAGIEVIAMDDDIITDDLLGSKVTDSNGRFCIYYRSIDFKKTFLSPFINVETTPFLASGSGPDIYFKYALGGVQIFAESHYEAHKPSRRNVGNCLCVNLCLENVEGANPSVPIGFYSIGQRDYHPIYEIDSTTGRTKGKSETSWNGKAFFSNVELRGSLNQKMNSQPSEYKFQYANVSDPSIAVGTIPEAAWNDVTSGDIARTKIADRLIEGSVWKNDTYVIGGTGNTDIFGRTEIKVEFDGNWIKVPQQPSGTINEINLLGSLIVLKTENLYSNTENKNTLVAGSAPSLINKNKYFALRMFKREAGNDASKLQCGFSLPLAIFNTRYDNVHKGGSWLSEIQNPSEFGIAMVDLVELSGPGNGCKKITDAIHVKYSAGNPNLGNVSIKFTGQGATNTFEAINYPVSGEEAYGTASYLGDFGDLKPCAYEIRLEVGLNLTNGRDNHHDIWDRILFCR
ncbi:Transthyretin-like family [Aequorivita sublithincola DSM 14238]|uniref:Transthyretin-like family n=1 Tax=Aequorivita sublithincola (strain DSM 14238 / LMG 21431 / ACAM 643 / 9-3) TaxID=746697 RepID=I3YU89_AEQSU|nr:transthyretin-like family [Aequorivita sublithincola]AFL80557.1 Transthyretin-like family [Aequorivita sublithincola DSM 14238]